MPWTPKPGFSGVMEDVVVPNILPIIHRDFKEALDFYFAADDLPDFAEHSLGQVKRKEFPLVAVGPIGNLVEESQDSARHTQPLRIALYLGVTADNDVGVTTLIMRYVKVMHGVLHKASWADYFGADVNRIFGASLEIEHSYGALVTRETLLFRSATMVLTLNFDSR
jgi:hypothetical protein